MRTIVAVVVIVLALTACSPGGTPDDASGEEIYAEVCSRCHGGDLDGGLLGPPLGPGSDAADETDEFLRFTIVNGRGRMPSFETTLRDDQVERLIDYIREIQDDA